ncbi:MAG: PbsX family transcriptional regulator [Burkholderiaceae bacterium]|jgi:antitoxin MazE|nr:PbsX family transcriptional regulator [Burkholderiaceae bacterium]
MYTLNGSGRMDAVIRKWGNSPALRLTTAVLKEAGLQLEERVELVVSKGQVIIKAIDKVEYDLDTLIDGINAKNSHGEVSAGAPVGKEAL